MTNDIEMLDRSIHTNGYEPSPMQLNRRAALKTLGLAAAALAAPAGLSSALLGETPQSKTTAPPQRPGGNPRWYGFNLLEYFSTDPDWMKYFPYKDDGMFPEDDFRWIRDWGFNWVRLPMDYRFWTDANDLLKIHEEKVAPIDRAIQLGEKYGIHVNVCLHRAPGYCVLDLMNESLTGIHVTPEKSSAFSDQKMHDAFVYQWAYFAKRYKGISSEKLSFNLVNEPLVLPTPTQIEELKKADKQEAARLFDGFMSQHARDYARVARASTEAIRKEDPHRTVIADGYIDGTGMMPVADLVDTGIMQSCHTYHPMQLTHYECEWARGMLAEKQELPTWPIKVNGVTIDRSQMAQMFQPWGELSRRGIPVHFGEMGCYKHTPPGVVLAWFDDMLSVLHDLDSGWALWNFRGPFGVLDTERAGTKYEDWHGHQLDRPLLNLLQKKMNSAAS